MGCQRKHHMGPHVEMSPLIIAAVLLSITFTSSHASGFHDHTNHYLHQQHNDTRHQTTTAKPGYFKPLQVVKLVTSASEPQPVTAKNDQVEQLPKPEAWKVSPSADVSKTAFGLPGYSGPEGFSPRRGSTAADYSANVAGFVPEANNNNGGSNDKKSQQFISQFEPAQTEVSYQSAALRSNNNNNQPDQFTRRYKERREPYSPFPAASNEDSVSQYLKTADPHMNNNNNNQGNSLGHPMGSASITQSYSSDGGYGSRNLDSYGSSSTRKKLSFSDEGVGPDGHPPQPFGSSDFHQSDLGSLSGSGSSSSPSSMFSSESSSGHHPMEHSVSASNDNELAQLAASMSDFSASPASSSPDFSSMTSGDQLSLADASGFGSLASSGGFPSGLGGFGSSSLLSGNPSYAASIPSPSSVPGVPAGAIVGAPGSAPPPGMKLAGYVTMAAPSNPMAGPGMGSMMNPMMAASMMRGNPMMSSMSAMRPFPMMGPSMGPSMGSMMNPMMGSSFGPMGMGPMGGSPFGPGMMPPMNPAMQQMLGGSIPGLTGSSSNNNNKQSATGNSNGGSSSSSSSSSGGSQASASNPAPARSRFLARLNPLNLFRRLRSRVAPGSKPTSTPLSEEAKVLESMLASESNPIPVKKGFSLLSRRSDNYFTNSSQDKMTAENFQHPFQSNFYRNTPFTIQPLFRFETPMNAFSAPRRRGRRIHESSPKFFDSDISAPSQGLMGSGNFEVIRGGLLPTASSIASGQESVHSDDISSSGRPSVLGFQGFNHFSSSPSSGSIYNSLPSDSNSFAVESLHHQPLVSSESRINAISQEQQQPPSQPQSSPVFIPKNDA